MHTLSSIQHCRLLYTDAQRTFHYFHGIVLHHTVHLLQLCVMYPTSVRETGCLAGYLVKMDLHGIKVADASVKEASLYQRKLQTVTLFMIRLDCMHYMQNAYNPEPSDGLRCGVLSAWQMEWTHTPGQNLSYKTIHMLVLILLQLQQDGGGHNVMAPDWS